MSGVSDVIGDMLTRIRNANHRKLEKVVIPHSKLKEGIAAVFKEEGFIRDFRVVDHPMHGARVRELHVYLKYGRDGERVIRGLKRHSKPGRRVFVGVDEIPRILDGFGTAVLSTPRGILSDRRARAERTGGELLCSVW